MPRYDHAMPTALQFRRAALPAIISGGVLISIWWLLRISWSAMDLVQGSFFLAALVVTFVAVPAGAAFTKFSTLCLSFAFQILAAGVFLAMVAMDSRAISVVALLAVFAVIATWIGVCSALPHLLRQLRLGIGVAIIAPLVIAVVALSFPVTIVPAHRALAGGTRADRFASAAVYVCPIYGMFNATLGEMPSPWPSGKNRVMYLLTIFDQNAANPSADWFTQSLILATLGVFCGGAAFLVGRRK